jgi:hypothetical protein
MVESNDCQVAVCFGPMWLPYTWISNTHLIGVLPLTSPHTPWTTFLGPRFIPPWPLLSFNPGRLIVPFVFARLSIFYLSWRCLPFICSTGIDTAPDNLTNTCLPPLTRPTFPPLTLLLHSSVHLLQLNNKYDDRNRLRSPSYISLSLPHVP